MAANTSPIFPLTPTTQWINGIVTANTTTDLTSGTTYLVFTAGGDGSRVDKIKVRALGTNVATVLRIWINNGSTTGTAANNTLYFEKTIAATTASSVAELADTEIPLNLSLPAGYKLYLTIGTAVAAGLDATAVGGHY